MTWGPRNGRCSCLLGSCPNERCSCSAWQLLWRGTHSSVRPAAAAGRRRLQPQVPNRQICCHPHRESRTAGWPQAPATFPASLPLPTSQPASQPASPCMPASPRCAPLRPAPPAALCCAALRRLSMVPASSSEGAPWTTSTLQTAGGCQSRSASSAPGGCTPQQPPVDAFLLRLPLSGMCWRCSCCRLAAVPCGPT